MRALNRSADHGSPTEPRCSIVIRAYNEEKHIGRLLTGILHQTMREVEIILVDSGSTDATPSIAGRFPVNILHIPPAEFTFGRSLNLGCSAAWGEIIVVASAHVYPTYPDWLEKLLAPFADRQVAMTYGKQRGNSTTRYSEHQILAKWFPDHAVTRQPHPFCNNANAGLRRSLWQEHPFDESLPALEDVAWATWALAEGYYLSYVPEAEVIHVHNETPAAVYNRYRREAMALKRIRPSEHFHIWDLLRLYPLNALSDFRHALRDRVLGRRLWQILWFRWMQFWGTFRGFALSGPLTSQLKEGFYYPRGLPIGPATPPRSVAPIDYSAAGIELQETP